MLRLCHAVPLAWGLSGCFLFHSPPEDAPARSDAGPPIEGPDAGRRDAGARDAGASSCVFSPASQATSACTSAGRTTLDVRIEGCFCKPFATCESLVDEPPGLDGARALLIETELCDHPDIDCDACVPFIDVECEVPPLEPRERNVYVNGHYAFRLPLPETDPDEFDRCWTFAAPHVPSEAPSSLSCHAPGPESSPGRVCYPQLTAADQGALIAVTSSCSRCFSEPSDCQVTVAGGRIEVVARDLDCTCAPCGPCPSECTELERTCRTPPLPEGSYELDVEGIATETITATHEPFGGFDVCSSAP
jgi:hypothetical protein